MKIIGTNRALHSPEFRKKKQKSRRFKVVIVGAVTLVLIGIPVYLSRQEKFLIASVAVEGNTVTKDEEVSLVANSLMSGNYLFVFPRANALIYPRGGISRELMAQVPRIKGVDLDLVDPQSLSIYIEERVPVALYCGDVSALLSPTRCHFLDENGFVFAEAPLFSGEVYFIYVSSAPLESPLGKELLPSSEFRGLSNFVKALGEMKVRTRALEILDEEYALVLPQGGRIMWKREKDSTEVRSNLETFLASDVVKNDPEFLSKVLYIDLRYNNKVFYKFQNEEEL